MKLNIFSLTILSFFIFLFKKFLISKLILFLPNIFGKLYLVFLILLRFLFFFIICKNGFKLIILFFLTMKENDS